jgi:hypothetical protein
MVVVRRLSELIKEESSPRIQTAALKCIQTIIRYDNVQTNVEFFFFFFFYF